jgi:uncharacterized protein YutE (UPF0331/DUF86 family)
MSTADKIFRKLSFMQRCIDYLKSIDPESTNLESNYEKRSAVERNFQLTIECAIDIGEIIIVNEGFERPEDYRSVFQILGRHEIIPKELAEKFVSVAEFRNILVHIYEEVDTNILRKLLTEDLKDFDTFTLYTAEYAAKLTNK